MAALVGSYAKAAARTACFDSPGDRVPGVFFSNRLWETVRAAALGTSGAPFATTDLSVSRGHEEQPLLGWPLFYEELPADIVASIIARRDRHASEGIQRILAALNAGARLHLCLTSKALQYLRKFSL